jgi:hypothetical protein
LFFHSVMELWEGHSNCTNTYFTTFLVSLASPRSIAFLGLLRKQEQNIM